MSLENFVSAVTALAKKNGLSVDFSTDEDTGKHIAKCSDGTTIIGNPTSMKVTVKWGSGHTAMATI